jgi:hypothetical protein
MKARFSDRSIPYANTAHSRICGAKERDMTEFIRSGLIVLMGMTVMAAGVLVIFYG